MLNVKTDLLETLRLALEDLSPGAGARAAFESPKVAAHGDLATTAAMQLAKPLKLNPRQVAEKLCAALRKPYQGATTKYDFSAPDMGGMTLAGFTYSKLDKGVFTRLPYKPAK